MGVRRRNAWLVRARTHVHTLTDAVLTYNLNAPDCSAALAAGLNFGPAPAEGSLTAAGWTPAAGEGSVDAGSGAVTPAGFGWVVATAPDIAR